MPNSIVFSNPGASIIRWGDGVAAPYLTLSVNGSTTLVGAAVTGTVTNTGSAAGQWSVASAPADVLISPSSGTLAVNAFAAFTLTALAAGVKTITLSSSAPGATVSGSPASLTVTSPAPAPTPPPPPPSLAPTGNITQYLTHDGDSVGDVVTSSAPTRLYWNTVLYSPWANTDVGDWLDAAQVAQGSTPYVSTSAVASAGERKTANVTTLVQRWHSNGLNRGFRLSARGNAFPVVYAGRTNATTGNRPELVVVTTTGTFNLPARCNASWDISTYSTVSSAASFTLTSGQRFAILQFDLASLSGTVTSATLGMTVSSLTQTGQIVDVFEANPPTLVDPSQSVTAPVTGVATSVAWSAVSALPAVVFADDMATPGPFDIGWSNTVTRSVDALRGTTWARSYIANGALDSASIRINTTRTTGSGAGQVMDVIRPEMYGRYRFKPEATFGDTSDEIKIPAIGSQFGWWNAASGGYWQSTTGNGGTPGTGLKIWNAASSRWEWEGHSTRLLLGRKPTDNSSYPTLRAMAAYIYHLDQVGGYGTPYWFSNIVVTTGNEFDVECRLKQNTMTGSQDADGNYATAVADGIYQVWVNGYQVFIKSDFRWRRHADFGCQGFWLDVYHGGTNAATQDNYYQVTEVVMATAYLGPSQVVPSWVPAAGEVAILSTANGKLTNTFISVTSPLYEPFYSAKIVNDYSGGTVNPYWGTYGMALYWGGGHAATNDNSVVGLELTTTGGTFKRLTTPSDLAASGTGPAAKLLNSLMGDATTPTIDSRVGSEPHAEYFDGQPVSPHSYGTLSVLVPGSGGAAKGTLIKVVHGAGAVCGFFSAEAAHKVDFATDAGATGSYAWARLTNNRGRYVSHSVNDATFAAPVWEAYVPSQSRIYHEANYLGAPRWFDLATNAYVIGTGAARAAPDSGVNGHMMFDVPERNLVVYLDRVGGILRAQYLDTTNSNPSWVTAGALSSSLTVASDWATACWCPDNSRIIVGNVASDTTGVYEIQIPATLSNPWTVTRAAFGGGQSIAWAGGHCYGKWKYNPRIRAITYLATADNSGTSDTVYVYRPRNT